MSTGEHERRVVAVAAEASRVGRRAVVAAAVGLPALVYAVVAEVAGLPARDAASLVAGVAWLVCFHTLVHGYHFGHDEGRGAASLLALPTLFVMVPLVWAAVHATGGRGAGRVRRITAHEH